MRTKTSRFVRFFSFFLTLTLVFVSFTSPAYALSKQQFSAWVAAALQAINITATASGMAAADASRNLMDYLATPYRIVLNQFTAVPYTTPVDNIDEYMNRSVIKIDKDIVTIDGVGYTDVWLSTDAAEKFRVNAFDLENAFDIASQSEGTFVSGEGYVHNVPIYNVNGTYRTQNYSVPYDNGSYKAGLYDYIVNNQQYFYKAYNAENYNAGYTRPQLDWPLITYQSFDQQSRKVQNYVRWSSGGSTAGIGQFYAPAEDVNLTPFDFDWVSGTIPADQQLEPNEGLRIRVPTSDIQPWYIQNPDLGPNITINMGDPELSNKIDDLIDLIIPLIPVLDIDFTTNESDPEPEPIPDPEPYPDPLPDPDITLIDSKLEDIIKALKNIFDNISIGNSITTAIKNLADQIKWVLDDILDKIGDLVDKIVKGNIDWFSDLIDAIKKPFLPWLNIFKLGVNIWHYVVEWIQNISAPFSYFWNILGSISPIYYSPIYAVAAASIVIAIYRRFGR